MTAEPVKIVTLSALDTARKKHKIISFDPNLRLPLWNDGQEAQKAIWYGIEYCDILKIPDNEIRWLTDMLVKANAAASTVTTGKGALCSMPELKDIKEIMRRWLPSRNQ